MAGFGAVMVLTSPCDVDALLRCGVPLTTTPSAMVLTRLAVAHLRIPVDVGPQALKAKFYASEPMLAMSATQMPMPVASAMARHQGTKYGS